MNSLSIKKFLIFSLFFSLSVSVCQAQSFDRPPAHRLQNHSRKGALRSKTIKVREPKAVEKAKNKAEAKEKKDKKAYAKSVKENQKHSIEIQTPEVKERMKQNIKNSNASYKAKKKNNLSRSKKSGRKYRR